MRAVMIRYRIKPEMVEENEQLVRAVYAELQAVKPAGLRYHTHKLPDGVSFVHVAMYDEGVDESPLPKLAAFKAFTADIKARCDELPATQELQPVGYFSSFG